MKKIKNFIIYDSRNYIGIVTRTKFMLGQMKSTIVEII